MPWPKEKLKQWRAENVEHLRATKRAYYAAHPEYRERAKEYMRQRRFYARYGISIEQYNLLLEAQEGRCALCRRKPKSKRRLCVDHCHSTKRVRGLLCIQCNTALGTFGDNRAGLQRALAYVDGDLLIKGRRVEEIL